ncbi:carnitine O-acetyltransferase, mitochondrial [[Candida] jaroonii]|uniref:Carnitine O-acetyltransferase, mitochondrial n=1 Tax=[Candida] jaroonii TaxID=467808 RepID=A0ACA9Y7K1_9ASCO|nr:carnitine O-acetyltransferase, mitochondrial [[Candida] jaroonii]
MTRQFNKTAVKGDLFKFQKDLPKLPVPTLEETSEKYLRSIRPFLNDQQFNESTAKVKKFLNGEGPQLQSKLVDFAKGKDNWLSEFWDDYAYMSYRDPVVPYVSYFLSHKDLHNEIGKSQLLKATLITYYTTKFMESVQNETLEPEIIKGNPYCMNAFHYMFNNSRVPAEGSDITVKYDGLEHQYFTVIINNHFYKVPHHINGEALTKEQIYSQLQYILNDSGKFGEGEPIGVLTSLNRDEWLDSYNNLVGSPINKASLDTIHASSFVICLDSNSPITIEEKSRNCWHGNGKNRFFDKPVEFFISANGNSGFLGEHSKMDATPTVQLNNYLMSEISKEDAGALVESIKQIDLVAKPEKLLWDINGKARNDISSALIKFNQTIESHDEEIFQYYGFGKNLIKQFKVSPDAFVQMVIQLAYFKYTGKIRPTYESAATRKFLKGRTETGRSVSIESKKFVETWANPQSSTEDKISSFNDACKQHVKYLTEAADGKGVDRHFLGLKQMIEPGKPVPEIFTDPIFGYSQSWYLSTSQIPSEYFQSWGFSQVIDDGFGCAYLINKDWVHVHISCKKGNGLHSKYLKWYLLESIEEMKSVLSTQLQKAKM